MTAYRSVRKSTRHDVADDRINYTTATGPSGSQHARKKKCYRRHTQLYDGIQVRPEVNTPRCCKRQNQLYEGIQVPVRKFSNTTLLPHEAGPLAGIPGRKEGRGYVALMQALLSNCAFSHVKNSRKSLAENITNCCNENLPFD